jgi:hypothetical protein
MLLIQALPLLLLSFSGKFGLAGAPLGLLSFKQPEAARCVRSFTFATNTQTSQQNELAEGASAIARARASRTDFIMLL